MLNLEYLMDEAKANGMPLTKKRGILREYLQVIILSGIYKHDAGKKIYFTGGTALRFFYNMPRFSEDLDFDTSNLTLEEFGSILESVRKELSAEGFRPEISSEKRKNLYIAELYFKDLMHSYGIIDVRGVDLMIKIEVYRPSWKILPEPDVLSLYGYNFSAVLLDKGNLFSEKIWALLNRNRGRDIYDTLFLLRKNFPLDVDVLAANNIKGAPEKVILEHLSALSEKELKRLAGQVRPFLFKEDDDELVLKAPLYAQKFLRR